MRTYHERRKEHPHIFWGFSNIRRAIHLCGQPYLVDVRNTLTTGPVIGTLSISPSGEDDTDIHGFANVYLGEVLIYYLLRSQVHSLLAEPALKCPLASGTPIMCPIARPDCGQDVTQLSKAGHKCLYIAFFHQFFDMPPHRLFS